MPEQQPATHKKPSRLVTIAAWSAVALLLPVCSAWVLGRWFYWFDIVASEQMLIGWITLSVAIVVLIAKRKAPGIVCATLAAASLYPVLVGRAWFLPSVDLSLKPDGVIRIVSCNINPENKSWRDDLDLLLSVDADVVILIEPPIELNRGIRKRGLLDSFAYPYWGHRAWVDEETSPGFILSRWPTQQIVTGSDPEHIQHHLYLQIQNPAGSFIVGLVHPLSPRAESRWTRGNRVIESQAIATFQIEKNHHLPVIVGADLNAGPGQLRARTFRRVGLEMSKPIARYGASFPSGSLIPRMVRLQLDDIWTTGGITPIGWDMIELQGSDHMAVVVDCALDSR